MTTLLCKIFFICQIHVFNNEAHFEGRKVGGGGGGGGCGIFGRVLVSSQNQFFFYET